MASVVNKSTDASRRSSFSLRKRSKTETSLYLAPDIHQGGKTRFYLFPLMTSKTYFLIGSIFMGLYVLTSLAVMVGVPEWAHQVCTIVFAGAIFLGIKKKKQENVLK